MQGVFNRLIFLIFAVSLGACTDLKDELEVFKDDVDFDANNRTMDIRVSRAEEIVLSSIQSAYLPHIYLPFFDFLDVTDLPENAVVEGEGFRADCAISGSANYTFQRGSELEYRKGDIFTVTYQDCMNTEGLTHDGTVSWKYSRIEGLNNRFTMIDSETCLARLDETTDGRINLVENIDSDGEYFPADSVRFIRVEDELELHYLALVGNEVDDEYEVVQTVRLRERAVVVIRSLVEDPDRMDEGVTRYMLASGEYPSVDGDEMYSVKGNNWEKENCQAFTRYGSVKATQLSATLQDGTRYSINDRFSAHDGSSDFAMYEQRVGSDELNVTWARGVIEDTFRFQDFEAVKSVSVASGSYSFRADGDFKHPDFGIARFETNGVILAEGMFEAPYDGDITILGQNFETIDLLLFPFDLLIRVDVDGDNDGDNVPDDDAILATFWQDLIDGVFGLIP
ncbi:MAG: hypothetical protein C9356_04535 [Oleiphilus sp.]|nr:MAG: hypothetical protein C9356_04535 [Oleiphilus sp.]